MNAQEVTREIMGNVPSGMANAFYVAATIACTVTAIQLFARSKRWRKGRPSESASVPMADRAKRLLRYLTFQEELRRDRFAGTAHLLTTYGFGILFMGTCLVFLEHRTPLHFFYGTFYLVSSAIIDAGGVAMSIGLLMFLWRRHIQRPERILQGWWITSLSWLLLIIAITGYLLEGARIAVDMPAFERWSFVGYGTAMLLRSIGMSIPQIQDFHQFLWGTHAVFCVAFFALLPWKFYSHMVYGALALASNQRQRQAASLRAPTEDQAPGATHPADLAWTDLLEADACTTCGRCNAVCPAHASGKPLKPRDVVLGLRAASEDSTAPLSEHVSDDTLWSCTTCGACNEVCPVGIDIYGKIVEMRKGRVEAGVVPEVAQDVFESSVANANPFGRPDSERMDWAGGLQLPVAADGEPVDLLYWVGCSGSFDPDGQDVTRAMTKILEHLGIRYHVLGRRERCTGDACRRLGEEGLFQQLAAANVQLLKSHGVRRILTHCPHCFNSLKNEYQAFGGDWEVEHHSQFLERMIRDKRLRTVASNGAAVTYHDPCYLGRGNGVTQPPREVVMATARRKLIELSRNREQSFCCGAGGGTMWLDTPGQERVENIRSREVVETGADTLATGCPFCKTMMSAGQQAMGEAGNYRVRDLAELVAEAEGLLP